MVTQTTGPGPQTASGKEFNFPTLYFEATRGCNLRCNICMTGSNDPRFVRQSRQEQLSGEEIERLVFAQMHQVGVKIIIWSGGEFLTRPDALELLRGARRHGYRSSVCTNGLQVNRERLLAIREAGGDDVVISLGINTLDTENTATRDADVDVTLRALDLCQELGIKRHVVVNLGRHNMRTLGKTFDFLYERRIPWNRSPFTARGSGAHHFMAQTLTREEMQQYAHPELRRHAFGYVSYTPFFLAPELHAKFAQGRHNHTVPQCPSIGCWCGTWLAMSAEGNLAPCAILLDVLDAGNVRETPVRNILANTDIFRRVLDRNQLGGKCGRCRYKFTCGGCRAMAFFASGDFMAEDPQCFFEPVDETTVCEHEAETGRVFERYALMARYAGGGI